MPHDLQVLSSTAGNGWQNGIWEDTNQTVLPIRLIRAIMIA